MLKFIPFIAKTLWRHRSRTILTVSGAAVALFVFCFTGAIQEGMNDLRRRQEAKSSLIVFQANKFCPATSLLPEDYELRIAELPGIREVVPISVLTNNCRASLDVIVFYGLPPKKLKSIRDFKLVNGSWSDFETFQDAAVVGQAVAERRGITVGQSFSMGTENSVEVRVAGIYTAEDPAEEHYIYTHLEMLQRRPGANMDGLVTQLEVLLEPNVDAGEKSREIDSVLMSGPKQTDTRAKGVFQTKSLGDLTQLIDMSQYLGFACVGLVLALVATTTIMSVQDRIKEHAVLQTLGFTSGRVFWLVLSESATLATIGGILGVGAAMLVLKVTRLAVGAEAVVINFAPTLGLAATGCLVAVITGIIAGIVPAWTAARAEIVSALRES
ncbi:MAG: ABC transporter permease [Pirellulales bacterium]|nr:ABC transporter permease [Pirellulales bacterium]